MNHSKWAGVVATLVLATATGLQHPPGLAQRLAAFPGVGQPATQSAAQEAASAKTWVGKAAEIEEYMKTAQVVRMVAAPRGVTRPRRAYLAPGGPVESIAWKTLRPGMSGGFYESYKSEIAAYELDKLLELNMVPPKVERRVENDLGVAIMWVTPTRSFADLGGVPKVPPAQFDSWNRQLGRAKIFHNLIGDVDPNLGNWLVDPAWNLILIDHSRALTPTKKLVHQMQRIDALLWERIKALTEETLTAAVGKWLGKEEIRAILERRDAMHKQIDRLVRETGEARVFVR